MTNETVYDIAQLLRRRNNDVGAPDFDDWNIADRLEAAHTREISSKYSENNRLREIVKELAKKLQSSYCCVDGESHFGTCDITGICPDAGTCALVSMAREVTK